MDTPNLDKLKELGIDWYALQKELLALSEQERDRIMRELELRRSS